MSGHDVRVRISNKLLGNGKAASKWLTLWVAKCGTLFWMVATQDTGLTCKISPNSMFMVRALSVYMLYFHEKVYLKQMSLGVEARSEFFTAAL